MPLPLEGALARGKDSNGIINDAGDNILIITYDLLLPQDVEPSQVLTNAAEISNYSNIGGGMNFIDTVGPQTDDANVSLLPPKLEKRLIKTGLENITNNRQQVVIGETVTYSVTLTIPEGTILNAKITDTMDAGLAYVGCNSITTSSGLLSSTAFASACTTPDVTPVNVGSVVVWDLGTLTNTNTDNSTPETITIEYDAVVLNVIGNQNIVPTTLDNAAVFSWDKTTAGGTVPASVPANPGASPVTVIEPTLDVQKSVTVNGSGSTGDAGDSVVYVINIAHTPGSQTDAYDMDITDVIPSKISSPVITGVTDSAAVLVPADFTISSNTLTNNVPIDVPKGRTIQITVTGTLAVTVNPGETLTNTASIEWTSLDGPQTDLSPYNNSTDAERTGDSTDPGGTANDYKDTASAILTIKPPSITKVYSGSNLPNTLDTPAPPKVAIGEIINYTVTINVPEGTSTGVKLVDTLDAGLAFVKCVSVTASPGLSNSIGTGAFLPAEVCDDPANPVNPINPAITATGSGNTAAGRVATWTFGDVVNSNTNNDLAEKITIVYQAVVLNTSNNVRGQTRRNGAVFTYNANTLPVARASVTIVEPTLQVDKMATPTNGDAGDTIIMQLEIKHTGASNVDAFNAVLVDELAGTGFTYNGFINCNLGSLFPTSCAFVGTKLTVNWDVFRISSTR